LLASIQEPFGLSRVVEAKQCYNPYFCFSAA
jgi:hypothetical protein